MATSTRRVIGSRFEIADPERDLLGRGGVGDVYRGRDLETGRAVAIKALRPEVMTGDPNALARFMREGEALRQLNHPNIVQMVDAIEVGGRHYLVTEYAPGGSLRDLLARRGRLSIERVVRVSLEVADALTRTHHLGILHRDLKPSNVLLAEDGTARLSDFGHAHLAAGSRLTQTGTVVGTAMYLSPEACWGETLDARADIWAFGVMTYEMLSGRVPFPGENFTAVIVSILTQPVPDLSQARPEAPDALADLVRRMLVKDRQLRIPSVRLVGAELEAILAAIEGQRPALVQREARVLTPTLSPILAEGRKTAGAERPSGALPPSDTPSPAKAPVPSQSPIPAAIEGERRLATVVLADVGESPELLEEVSSEVWAETMNEVLQILASEVYRYGGEIGQFREDGLVALFGATVAHEDDPERAVLAALAMQEAIQRYVAELPEGSRIRLLLRIGVNTGEVIVARAADGSPDRQGTDAERLSDTWRPTAIGRAIALAAQVKTAAEPGTVLVGENTYRQVHPLFEWETLDQPFPAHRPLAHKPDVDKPRGIAGLESPLVGRQNEFRALQEAVERVQSGIAGIVTIVGEAGIGKSRLVIEAQRRVTASDIQWIEGRCVSYGASTAYQLWLNMVHDVLGVAPDAAPAAVVDALQELVQDLCSDRFGDVYPYLARMLSLPLGQEVEAILDGLGAEGLKAGTFRGMETLAESAAQRWPLVIVCEDLHWADPTSLELLEYMLALTDRVPLLLICILRPDTEHACWRIRETAAREYRHCHTDLRLYPLSAADSETLMGNLLHIEDLPRELKEDILSHADGNPFYVEEILRSLMDSGAITREEGTGRWYATRGVDDIALPDTLHGVMMARIDRLGAGAKRVLQLASVIGRIFAHRVLAAIVGERGQGELQANLVALQRAQMIRERTRVPEPEYDFEHHLTQEAAYSGLLHKERRLYHRQVAEALERFFASRIEEYVEMLAHHWESAEEPEKAILYLLQAGDRARRLGTSLEAIDFYQLALQKTMALSVPGTVQVHEIHERLGDTYLNHLSRYDEALEHYTALLTLAESDQDLARGAQRVGSVHLLRGDLAEAQECFESALARLSSLPPLSEASRAHVGLAYLLISRHQLDQAEQHAQASLAISSQIGDTRGRADAHRTMGIIANRRGETRRAKEHHERSLELYRELGDLMRIGQTCNNLAECYRVQGQMDRALELLDEGLQVARRIGDTRGEALLLTTTAELYLDQGRWESASEHLEQVLSLAQESGTMARLIQGHRLLGVAYERVGRLEDARHHLETAEALGRDAQYLRYAPRIYLDLAHLHATRGAFDEAQRCIDMAREAAGPEPSDLFLDRVHRCYGYLFARREDWDAAIAHLEASLQFLMRTDLPVQMGETRLDLGTAYARRGKEGDRGRAREHLLAALSTFCQIGAQRYLTVAEAELAKLGYGA